MTCRTSVASAVLWLALAAGAAAVPVHQNLSDSQLVEEVVRSVNAYPRLTIFDDINVHVDRGDVTLTGKVTMPVKKNEIAQRVSAVGGVKSVTNDIDVLPASIPDDELRQRVARAIYGHSAFWRYAALPRPPIHIIVEDGRVTLTGVVDREADRTLARSLAAGQGGISVTNALRTEGARVH